MTQGPRATSANSIHNLPSFTTASAQGSTPPQYTFPVDLIVALIARPHVRVRERGRGNFTIRAAAAYRSDNRRYVNSAEVAAVIEWEG